MSAPTPDKRALGRWLAIFAATVFVLVLVGGATRLTESGLSITEWKPVSGVVPPMNEAAWNAEFDAYKRIPQYAQMNAAMTLDQFKVIFWWEFAHRFLARLVGLIFALPFFWFLAKKRIPRELMPRLVTIGVLIIVQAALGWYMVASGLVERVNVSQYRLAAHLSLALVLYLLAVWTADRLTADRSPLTVDGAAPVVNGQRSTVSGQRILIALLLLASLTVISGAFVAGLRAGHIYNEFPRMGAGFIPIEYGTMSPWWKDLLENPASAQFNHRVLAMVTLVAVIVGFVRARAGAHQALRSRLNLVLGAVLVQVALGITALLLSVPVVVGIAHQAGALLLLTALVLSLSEAERYGRPVQPN
jgi:cytochrome c oxidase assembly protein subunit 15